jgi:hypothetical protein
MTTFLACCEFENLACRTVYPSDVIDDCLRPELRSKLPWILQVRTARFVGIDGGDHSSLGGRLEIPLGPLGVRLIEASAPYR